jgi:Ribonuclease G/E
VGWASRAKSKTAPNANACAKSDKNSTRSSFGLILRTESEGKTEKEIGQDIEYLTQLWQQIRGNIAQAHAPALVHRDASLLYRVLRDVFSSEVDRLWIDDPEEYEKVHEVLKVIAPALRTRVMLYDKPTPMFEQFNIEKEMERLLRRKVWLKSGGYITIDETEAFTAIDVNTGKFTGKTSLAETILKTNLEAVEEVCRQLRLRDIGGIIVVDFIDMGRKSDHRQVMQALQRTLKRDRARFRIGRISSLGLVELTRKRTGESVTESLTRPCPTCHGRGRIPAPDTVSLWIERDLAARALKEQVEAYLIEAHPSVVEHLVGEDGVNIDLLEHQLEVGLFARARPDLPIDEYRVQGGALETLKRQHLPYKLLQVVECQLDALRHRRGRQSRLHQRRLPHTLGKRAADAAHQRKSKSARCAARSPSRNLSTRANSKKRKWCKLVRRLAMSVMEFRQIQLNLNAPVGPLNDVRRMRIMDAIGEGFNPQPVPIAGALALVNPMTREAIFLNENQIQYTCDGMPAQFSAARVDEPARRGARHAAVRRPIPDDPAGDCAHGR